MPPLTQSQATVISGGLGAAATLGTGLLGMIGQRARERRAMANQRELMDLQFQNQQALNEQGQQLQLDTWEKTNYPAQVAMLKEAGLNPALLYGKGGGGGATTGSQGGGSAASGNAPAPQSMMMPNIMNGIKEAAEIALIKAQARKTDIEAAKTAGVDTELTKTTIQKLIAETQNDETKNRLIELESDIAEINKANRQYQIDSEINNTIENTNKLKLENSITSDAYESIINEIKQRAIGQTLENELTKAKTKLTETEKSKLTTDIVQKWSELAIRGEEVNLQSKKTDIDKFEAELKAKYPTTGQAIGRVLNNAFQSLYNLERLVRGFKTEDPEPKVKYNK